VVGLLDDRLPEVYGARVKIWQHQPLRLPPLDEPVPDLAVLRRREDNSCTLPSAEDALLVIEVVDSSPLQRDLQTKARVYGTLGSADDWVVDLAVAGLLSEGTHRRRPVLNGLHQLFGPHRLGSRGFAVQQPHVER